MDRDRIDEELKKPLGPEFVQFKAGHAYLEGHKAVALANEIFGFDGWSSEIKRMEIDFAEETNRRFNVAANCVLRVTLKTGNFHEDIGYGSSTNMPSRFQAYEKARKEAATDALKRALRQFGESTGNCVYNKEYIDVVKRTKKEKLTYDEEDMRRPRKKIKSEAPQPAVRPYVPPGPPSGTAAPSAQPVRAAAMHSTPLEPSAAPAKPSHKPAPQQFDLPSDVDDTPPDFGSDVVIEANASDADGGFTSGAGYDGGVGMQAPSHEPYDVSKSIIHSTRTAQDRSGKVFK